MAKQKQPIVKGDKVGQTHVHVVVARNIKIAMEKKEDFNNKWEL